mmetsp:Transcript_36897/g.56660  ORF Transcript_36897/g.56660 Transcript_36897/m.56660 type:complete len:306 (-) Transcript_36897:252-1169(-)|eukprot:CAMPEP_0118686062 /NCGR_PEP_ID=MMETSP0800-20121206/7600_1 /TAXON_ID=210618 ORGANISM="Striatella unipunctata, Strain CCMP2910" /NCGR_SAMPLE_ID=MMETSP0800 /ASSEMBLY_ACC=CAM_ASM_000638 /LENGTH=305 /DNA_ID=CAMNT_0006583057 /DNA_START=17 /DNA_END=934 /DNA_ORIENTATION=+
MKKEQRNVTPERGQRKKDKRKNRKSQSPQRAHSPKERKGDAPMDKRDIYFALDCEMVGVGEGGKDSALARVSIVNWNNELVFDKFIAVSQQVTDYRTFVSGVQAKDLQSKDAISFRECKAAVQNILKGKILIGHGLVNDLAALKISHPWCDMRDTATYSPYMRMTKDVNSQMSLKPRKLRDLTWEKLGRQIQVQGKPHSSVEDAIAALDLYKAARNDWEGQLQKKVNKAIEIEQRRLDMLSQYFNAQVPAPGQMPPKSGYPGLHPHHGYHPQMYMMPTRPLAPRAPVNYQPMPQQHYSRQYYVTM